MDWIQIFAFLGAVLIAVFCSIGISVTFVLARIGFDYVKGSYRDARTVDKLMKLDVER